MTLPLRITLFAASLLTFGYMTAKIRDSKMRLEDSLFWFCFSALLLLGSVFLLSNLVGTMSPSNFVFLFFIFILLIVCFKLSVRLSQLDTKLRELTQQLAIEKYERHHNDKTHEERR
mgnify:CR=1 FL=1